jgi:hypothetical protein
MGVQNPRDLVEERTRKRYATTILLYAALKCDPENVPNVGGWSPAIYQKA